MRIAHIYLIVQVETTVACITDGEVTDQLHEEVAKANLRPAVHLLDSGYVDSHVLCRAQEQHGIRVVGPVAVESRWQARAGKGFDLAHFQVDWVAEQVTCPQGQTSQQWLVCPFSWHTPFIQVRFARATCQACAWRRDGTHSKSGVRALHLRPQASHQA